MFRFTLPVVSSSVGLTERKAERLQQYHCLVCCEMHPEKYGPYKHRYAQGDRGRTGSGSFSRLLCLVHRSLLNNSEKTDVCGSNEACDRRGWRVRSYLGAPRFSQRASVFVIVGMRAQQGCVHFARGDEPANCSYPHFGCEANMKNLRPFRTELGDQRIPLDELHVVV